MSTVTNETALIRSAVYGKDVREAIASGIEAIDAEQSGNLTVAQGTANEALAQAQEAVKQTANIIAQSGTSNTETVDIRTAEDGTVYTTAGDHVRQIDSDLAQKANSSDLTTTNGNVTANTTKTNNNALTIATLASGSPTPYATLALLQVAFPTGNTKNYLNLADGYLYYWNNTAWTKGWLYQATGISNNSVGYNSTSSNVQALLAPQVLNLPINKVNDENAFEVADVNGNLAYFVTKDGVSSATNYVKFPVDDTGYNYIQVDSNGNIGLALDINGHMINPQLSNAKIIKHIIGIGQSLSIGAQGTPALSVRPEPAFRGKNLMFNGGVRVYEHIQPDDGTGAGLVLTNDVTSYFKDIFETNENAYVVGEAMGLHIGETMASSMLTTGNNGDEILLFSVCGVVDGSYAATKQGTNSYNNNLIAVQRGMLLAEQQGCEYIVEAITCMHGEADASSPIATYEADLLEWYTDYNTDIKAITGQTQDIKFFISPTASASGYSLPYAFTAVAAIEASKVNDNIIIIGPKYQFPYMSVHMQNVGYRRLGEIFGRALFNTFNRQKWIPLIPLTCTNNNDGTIDIAFNVPKPPLVLDTTLLPNTKDGAYGFNVESSNNVTITGVEILGSTDITKTTIRLTCSAIPPVGSYVSYAYIVDPTTYGYTGILNGSYGVHGCLRDSDSTPSYYEDYPLYNYCVAFRNLI